MVDTPIANQNTAAFVPFVFQVPAGSFTDPDGARIELIAERAREDPELTGALRAVLTGMLLGILLAVLPVPAAMALPTSTQGQRRRTVFTSAAARFSCMEVLPQAGMACSMDL